MKKSVLVFFIVIVVLLLGVISLQVISIKTFHKKPELKQGWTEVETKEYANKLISKGLKREGAEVLAKYCRSAHLDNTERAQACFRLGKIYLELFEYEKALSAFYKAEMLDKDGEFIAEMNSMIVEALENLGMSSQAKYEMQSRVAVDKASVSAGVPIARIGKDFILQSDIDKELNSMPGWMRERFDDPAEKDKFVQEFISREVLYRKAKRLGLDRSAEMREAVELFKKQRAVQTLIEKEIGDKIDVDADDIETFYKANMKNYTEPEGVKVSYVSFSHDEGAEVALKKIETGEVEDISEWISEGMKTLPGIGEAESVIATLLLKETGDVTDPLKIGDSFYIFKINDKRAVAQKSFDEVKSQVQFELQMKEQEKLMHKLLKDVIEEQEVEIYKTADNDKVSDAKNDEKAE